jgi:hypothetical protein
MTAAIDREALKHGVDTKKASAHFDEVSHAGYTAQEIMDGWAEKDGKRVSTSLTPAEKTAMSVEESVWDKLTIEAKLSTAQHAAAHHPAEHHVVATGQEQHATTNASARGGDLSHLDDHVAKAASNPDLGSLIEGGKKITEAVLSKAGGNQSDLKAQLENLPLADVLKNAMTHVDTHGMQNVGVNKRGGGPDLPS